MPFPKEMAPRQHASPDNESDEEEGSTSEEQKQQLKPQKPESEDSQEESEDSQEKSEEKPNQAKSNEGSESDSESGFASAYPIKPSQPIENIPKFKNPKPKSTVSNPSAKRANDTDQNATGSSKKRSKISNGDKENGLAEEKKGAVNRLFTEQDIIAILQGMIEYQAKKGSYITSADMSEFLEFVKGSLSFDVVKIQLSEKLKRLKQKYRNNAAKGKNGEDPLFASEGEHKKFQLSKQIWGAGPVGVNRVDDRKDKSGKGKGKKNNKVGSDSVAKEVESKGREKKKDFWAMYPLLYESLESDSSSYLLLPKNFLKERISLIGRDKASQFEEKWKAFRVMECELYAKRLLLIHEATQLVVDGMKRSEC